MIISVQGGAGPTLGSQVGAYNPTAPREFQNGQIDVTVARHHVMAALRCVQPLKCILGTLQLL